MAEVTTKMVANLCTTTDLDMMEYKKALVEAEGNFGRAEEILRIESDAKTDKLAGRTAAEGVLAYTTNDSVGALIEVNCKTNFVTKDADFIEFANFVTKTTAEKKPATVEELSELVETERKTVIVKLGENMSVCRFRVINTVNQLVAYIHDTLTAKSVLVEFKGSEDVARKIGMRIVAAKPQCVTETEVDAETIEKERHIYTEQTIASGKPADITTEMVEGCIRKLLVETTLNGQALIMDPDQAVAQFAKENGTEVVSFVCYKVGSNIEEAIVDYAVKVAAAARV